MLHWADGPLCAFDTESTGVDPKTARILQAAIVSQFPDGSIDEEHTLLKLINPGVPIPAEASAIHGITEHKLKDAWTSDQAIPYLCGLLYARSQKSGIPLVIYNAGYDLPLLLAEAERIEWALPPGFAPLILDPLVIDRALDKYRKGSRKLDAVAAHYHVPLKGSHDARADATANPGRDASPGGGLSSAARFRPPRPSGAAGALVSGVA